MDGIEAGNPALDHEELALFRRRAEDAVGTHPIVVANDYTRWFARGDATQAEVRHLTVQFSVFSHQFIEAQLRKVINAGSLAAYRKGKEILVNELGVAFRPADVDGRGATAGTVDRSVFRFEAAHFEWLVEFASFLGLRFEDLGKRRHATPSTLVFCDELLRIYGSEDASVAAGASYAIEHWAAGGFWKELIAGLSAFERRHRPGMPLGFWVWHDRLEDQHAAHTSDELASIFAEPGFSAEAFLLGARATLDGVRVFWNGLWRDHLAGLA